MAQTQLKAPAKVDSALIRRLANTVRGLSIDGVEAADSGHPGLPLGCADFATTLWFHFLRYNPKDVNWPNRDKFILSGGHGSMLLYSLLHLAGYDLKIDDLKNFRQFGSRTPGHPENFMTPGVETTTGPLGQGFANGIGFALADKMLAARVNKDGFAPIDCYVYGLVSDGDLMEGIALEAASFAGHLRLGNVIYLYDDNDITLDGPADLTFREDTAKKFEAMHWHVQKVDGHDPQQVADSIFAAQKASDKPSLIICKTTIGYGSPNKAGTSGVHGSPLGKDEAKLTKEKLGIPAENFHVPQGDRDAWAERAKELKGHYEKWYADFDAARDTHADAVKTFEAMFKRDVPKDLESRLPKFDPNKSMATRKAGEAVLKAIGAEIPWLVGGSADLSVSTNAVVENTKVSADSFTGRHIYFGVREHAMGGICNGMTMQGAFRAFGGTFFTFSDYMRGAVRLSALMHSPSIWVWSHDSIFLGEDGPTHQPVEHLAAVRAIPHLVVIRPADAVETGHAWLAALRSEKYPTGIVLTRQNVPTYDRSQAEFNSECDVAMGAYVLRPEKNKEKLDGILIGTGSEVQLCVEAARKLEEEGISVRVVSMPSWELFEAQPESYRRNILPPSVTARVAVEAGVSQGWHKYVGEKGELICRDDFGASAPYQKLAEEFGFTAENVVKKFKKSRG